MVTPAFLLQFLGLVAALAGGFMIWGAWSLVAGGAILVVVPEIAAAWRPRR